MTNTDSAENVVAELRREVAHRLQDGMLRYAKFFSADNVSGLLALIESQRATIERQDDELIGERWHADEAARQRDVVKAALAAAKAEKERLREALEPFAREADARSNLVLGPDIDGWPIGGSALTLGDLRRARAALTPPATGDGAVAEAVIDPHPTIPPDVLTIAEDLIPQMDAELGKRMRGSMVYYAARAIMTERAALAASPAPAPAAGVAVPDGWKLVPVEPTVDMIGDGGMAMFKSDMATGMNPREATIAVYRAMIAAAPSPKAGETGNG